MPPSKFSSDLMSKEEKMDISLQKASFGKRIIATIFDMITVVILAVGLAVGLSSALNYDTHYNTYYDALSHYSEEYGIDMDMTAEQINSLSSEQQAELRERYDAMNKAINEDEKVVYAYNMFINLSLIIATASIFFGVLVIEFVVPLILKNGQTLGKKIFGIAVMHVDSIKVSGVQLFARAILGKFTFEIMIPLAIIMMIFFNLIGIMGSIILFAILIAEIICLVYNKKNMLLHDVIGATVCVDFLSQRIFESREEKEAFIKKKALEQAEKAAY